jgi:FkbM family methyltransferase
MVNLNYLLYQLSLRGMGILNYQDLEVSGEATFIDQVVGELPSPTVFDVGANEGDYASAIRRANHGARIYAFEPHPGTFERLKQQAQQNDFHAVQTACGSEEVILTLYDYEMEGASHASAVDGVIGDVHQQEEIAIEVPVTTIDAFARSRGIDSIDLLKVDTEGYELEVFKGAQSMIEQGIIKCIQLEFNEMNVQSRTFARDFVELLDDFRFFRTLPGGLVELGKYHPLKYEIFAFQNLTAVHKKAQSILNEI